MTILLSLFFLFMGTSVYCQTCQSEPGVSSVLLLTDDASSSDCYFLGRTTNPAVPCSSCPPCSNNQAANVLRVTGDWTIDAGSSKLWDAVEPLGLLIFDEETCAYTLSVTGLKKSTPYKWKVTVNNGWDVNYGCGNGNCAFASNSEGSVRFLVKPTHHQPALSTDYNLGVCGNGVCEAGESCGSCPEDCGICPTKPITTTDASISTWTTKQHTTKKPFTTLIQTSNPTIPCTLSSCPSCSNNLASQIIRTTGSWTGNEVWDPAQPNGLFDYDANLCKYTLVMTGLKPKFEYRWKVTVDNSWAVNYGCNGNGDCVFTTNSAGAIRFIVEPTSGNPILSTDFNVAECGDGICEEGESCDYCPEDCGTCPPPVCGDGVCEGDENYLNCPADCTNELPGCDRFNDDTCQSGSQYHANPGQEKRRWQTPKPGQPNYQDSFQDYHSLVGYGDIRYTNPTRTEADVCIVAIHRKQDHVTMEYYFNDEAQSSNCKRFSTAHKSEVSLKVKASDGTQLVIPAMRLLWNAQSLTSRPGDYRNGQKGGIAEMFGWPHKDIEKECELLSKAGYLGVKLFPVHEQVMSTQPFENVMNPWYFMYQPVSYKLDGRMGTREELQSLINTCRSLGVRVYNDIILNHFSGAGNDLLNHRNPSAGCATWGNKTSSAPVERQSPYYTHAYTYQYNINTGEAPSNEFPGAGIGPEDFHCERSLGSWSDLFILNNGWLVGLTDIDTSKDNVRERQAAYIVEMISMGISGFRIDAAKHVSPEDISGIMKKVQAKLGGQFTEDFFVWLEIITGGEANLLWTGQAWYGHNFDRMLLRDLGSQSEVDKIKLWDGLYPKEPFNNPAAKNRVVIQNDDHDQQNPGSTSRDMGPFGCVLVKNCPTDTHRNFETKLFENPNGVGNNDDDWPIRFVLSSYYHTYGHDGIPDGLSDCSLCTVTCQGCKSVPFMPAYDSNSCGYSGDGYTRVHRDVKIINAMRKWVKLGPISGGDIGLPGC